MKKILLFGLLIGLIGPTQVLAGEMAVGARITPYSPLQYSVDFLYRPKLGIGGVVAGNSDYDEDFRGRPLAIKTKDLTVLVGYWSNKDKKNWLGWHGYFGIGISFVDVVSQKYTHSTSYANNSKYGLGLDLYLARMSAVTVDVSVTSRNLQLQERTMDADTDSTPFPLKSRKDIAFQVGYRIWF